jgi:hypothetical protein
VTAPTLIFVEDDTLEQVVAAPHGALVLAKGDCENCAAYERDIRRLQEGGLLGDLIVGKLVLTQPGCRRFKRENPWLRDVDVLPYTLLYARGQKVDEFAASRGTYLLERAADAGFL